MAVEKDHTAWLPEPPPPRPARRDAAIEAALRRFDGVEELSPAVPDRPGQSWAATHRPQLAMAASVLLVAFVGIPAALIGFRSQPTPREQAPPAAVEDHYAPPAPRRAPAPTAKPVAAAPTPPPLIRKYQGVDDAVAAQTKPSAPAAPPPPAVEAPAPADSAQLAQAAPPAAPEREVASNEAPQEGGSQNIIVTGGRIPAPNVQAAKSRAERDETAFAAGRIAPDRAYTAFLAQLQGAIRSKDRGAVIALIAFPLRVNRPSGTRLYRDAASIDQDFGRIFTAKVRRAILKQRADRLFVRDQGAMIGDGEVWFDHIPAGPVRIRAVNP